MQADMQNFPIAVSESASVSPKLPPPVIASPDATHDYGPDPAADLDDTKDYGPSAEAALEDTHDYGPTSEDTIPYPDGDATVEYPIEGNAINEDSSTREIEENDLYDDLPLASCSGRGDASARILQLLGSCG